MLLVLHRYEVVPWHNIRVMCLSSLGHGVQFLEHVKVKLDQQQNNSNSKLATKSDFNAC